MARKPTGQCIYSGDLRELHRAGYVSREPTQEEIESLLWDNDMVLIVDRDYQALIVTKGGNNG